MLVGAMAIMEALSLVEDTTAHIGKQLKCDFNNHVGTTFSGFDDVHGAFDFGDRNEGGASFLDFTRTFKLIANSNFPKKKDHLTTFRNAMVKTQIDYILLRKVDRDLCKDCKVIPSENLTT
ncbi:hypothetical protein H5410_044381 [Solanum commersonii]|uniref:Uncharacterized protein n=1 Tax=Solanum commersonii TaxID=4109 RepID=A0A9J5X6W0_SOLCO|nr:hypothetical protein H5410_044381 [Solanum commersonii]